MKIKLYEDKDCKRWDQYVWNSSGSNLYHLAAWKNIIENSFGHKTYYLYSENNGKILGILPLVHLRSFLFGSFFVSVPFFNYGGVCADDQRTKDLLVEEAIKVSKERGAEYIELRHTENYNWGLPVKTHKVAMVLNLPAASEELWKCFKSKLRSQIRKPEKEGLEVRWGGLDGIDVFYEVFSTNMRDLGTPVYPKVFFINILNAFPGTSRICTVYLNDKPLASGFVIGFKNRLEIPWASSLKNYNHLGANMMLYWNMLKYACDSGYRQFDFGRSTPGKGTYKFKEQWGSTPHQLYWHYWVSDGHKVPELNPHNPKYSRAIKIWQKLPLSFTRFFGPHIVKNIP